MTTKLQLNTIVLILFMFCSFALTQKEKLDTRNVQIFFENNVVPFGILHKFDDFIEKVDDEDASQAYGEYQEVSYYDDDVDADYDEEETDEEAEEYIEAGEELTSLIKLSVEEENTAEDQLNEDYLKFVFKLCLLTAISKEATLFAIESVTF